MKSLRLPLLLLLSALAVPTRAGEVSTFLGTPGGFGDIVVFDEVTATAVAQPPELSSLRLLPLDFTGRSRLDALLPDRPRLDESLPGAGRIRLPHGVGSLYRFQRNAPGGTRFGYAFVGVDGVARNVFEVPGTGISGLDDPLPFRVAIAPDGTAILTATTVAAGGNLIEVDLLAATAVDRTAALGPREFEDGGLSLAGTWGVGCTPGVLFRFDRTLGGQASKVAFPGSPGWCLGGMAKSEDGAWMATAVGDDASRADVYVFGAQGPPLLVTDQKASLTTAGFLPDAPDGPYLALSPDGGLVAWRAEVPRAIPQRNQSFVQRQPLLPSKEIFVRKAVSAPRPSLQVTGDLRFADTLDDSGVIGFISPQSLVMMVGATTPMGVGDADLYQVALDPTGAAMATTNLSLTSGDPAQPFLAKGDLEPGDLLLRVPGTTDVLLHSSNSSMLELSLLHEGVTGRQVLVPDCKELDFLEAAGGQLLAGVHRKKLGRRDLVRITPGPSPVATLLGSVSETSLFTRPAAQDDTVGFVIQVPGGELVARTHVAAGTTEVFGMTPIQVGPVIGFSPLGSLLVTWQVAGRARFGVWPEGAPAYPLETGPTLGHVLPGP